MGIRSVVYRVRRGAEIRGGVVRRGDMPTGWANTAAEILYQYQFARNGGVVFDRKTLETYGHVQNVNHMDRLRAIYLSHLFSQMAAYTEPEAKAVCYLLHDVAEVMFLEKLQQDVDRVIKAGGVPMEIWQPLEEQVTGLFLQKKTEVRGRILQFHNRLGFSTGTLYYASFSTAQVDGRPHQMGPHGYAGSIYFQNGRIRLIHNDGPKVFYHLNAVQTITNKEDKQENVIVEPQDSQEVLDEKIHRIRNARIYEYDPAHLATPIPGSTAHGAAPQPASGGRVVMEPQRRWKKFEFFGKPNPFHHSRGVPRKVSLTNQQIETLFFLGGGISGVRENLPAGAQDQDVVRAGNKLVLEYINLSVGLRQSLGYG